MSVAESVEPEEHCLKALVVEDEKDMETLISYHLNKEGIQTTPAKDGEHGLNLALKRDFDIIVLDLMLPMVSGMEICRQLKLRNRLEQTPILLVTAVSESIVENLLSRLEVAEVVFKPFKPEEFMKKVRKIMGRSREEQPPNP